MCRYILSVIMSHGYIRCVMYTCSNFARQCFNHCFCVDMINVIQQISLLGPNCCQLNPYITSISSFPTQLKLSSTVVNPLSCLPVLSRSFPSVVVHVASSWRISRPLNTVLSSRPAATPLLRLQLITNQTHWVPLVVPCWKDR